jgi:hypothetical protein
VNRLARDAVVDANRAGLAALVCGLVLSELGSLWDNLFVECLNQLALVRLWGLVDIVVVQDGRKMRDRQSIRIKVIFEVFARVDNLGRGQARGHVGGAFQDGWCHVQSKHSHEKRFRC